MLSCPVSKCALSVEVQVMAHCYASQGQNCKFDLSPEGCSTAWTLAENNGIGGPSDGSICMALHVLDVFVCFGD